MLASLACAVAATAAMALFRARPGLGGGVDTDAAAPYVIPLIAAPRANWVVYHD